MAHAIMFDFDTLRYANELKAAGVPDKQAEVQAHMLGETIKEQNMAINNLVDNSLATKHDIELVKKEIEFVRKDIELVKKDITIRMGGMIFGAVGIMLGVIVPIMLKIVSLLSSVH